MSSTNHRPGCGPAFVVALTAAVLAACSPGDQAPSTTTVTERHTVTERITATVSPTRAAPTGPAPAGVIYRLYSTVQNLYISWISGDQRQSRDNAQIRDRTPNDDGWVVNIRTDPSNFYSIDAATINDDVFAFLRCEVRVDGRLVIEDDSSGADAQVNCRYTP